MKFLSVSSALLVLAASTRAAASDKKVLEYQSDVSRLRQIVVNSLYGSKEVFLREIISNSNDALEKLRLTGLLNPQLQTSSDLNITISTVPTPEDPESPGQLIIRDTGIGMTSDELTKNLGTIAKSGTTEFLSNNASNTAEGNLIGQFGLGFYSTFLVADQVYVSSVPPAASASASEEDRQQYTFASAADGDSFEVYPDSRGNTLGLHGTEIIMVLRKGESEWLDGSRLKELIAKHSSFSTTFPIYLEERKTISQPVASDTPASSSSDDEEEGIVEETSEEEPETEEVEVVEYTQLNLDQPIWMRDPKTVSDEDYDAFYTSSLAKGEKAPLTHNHWKGSTASGINFRALAYTPSSLPEGFWSSSANQKSGGKVKMMVKRVFITDDLGDNFIPKWLSFVNIVIDADDLPLTVSRETIKKSKFTNQLSKIIIKKTLDQYSKIAEEDPEKFSKIYKLVGNALKIGTVDPLASSADKDRLSKLLRFDTNLNKSISLSDYVSTRRKGQTQIFFLAGVGQTAEELSKSPFIESLHARGYQVLLLSEPMDETALATMRAFEGMKFQDVTKKGMKFGDEDADEEEEKAEYAALVEKFEPLTKWFKEKFTGVIGEVIVSKRLVTSPTAIVASDHGVSANMMRLMASQSQDNLDPMFEFMKKQAKILEINPRSPLILGLLKFVEEGDGSDGEETEEIAKTLLDISLVKSGYSVDDSNEFFSRVESLLRRSIGVSTLAQTKAAPVKPAPEIDESPVPEEPEFSEMDFMDFDREAIQKMAVGDVDEDDAQAVFSHDEL